MGETASSAGIRARLSHPVIDADGHWMEFMPAVVDAMAEVGGPTIAEGFYRYVRGTRLAAFGWYDLAPTERLARRAPRPPWWGTPTRNTRDRATAMLPKLLYARLDEFGLDFSVVYPSIGMVAPHVDDEEVRRASCRAFNRMHAEVFREFSNRLAPVAVIPMHTPEEALEELDYAVDVLGFKVVLLAGFVERPIPALARIDRQAAAIAPWIDVYGMDSEHDYDPVWARCRDLGVAPTFHAHAMGWMGRSSPSSYVYNHLGAFAGAHEPLCKALFLGGVTRRFPELRFAFLEGGVGWAAALYSDLIDHWEKRNLASLANYDPANLDRQALLDYVRRYGDRFLAGRVDDGVDRFLALVSTPAEDPARLDEFAPCRIERAEEIRELFAEPFFFGCEADTPTTAIAFQPINRFGARLRALFSSDISHWDVPDMSQVLVEAHEHVEHGRLDEESFRDFVFGNAARLFATSNPAFFKGTAVEHAVDDFLVSDRAVARA